MNPYATAGWENFFVAEVGASAALAGLIFVAVPINLSKILAIPQLPGRAGENSTLIAQAPYQVFISLSCTFAPREGDTPPSSR